MNKKEILEIRKILKKDDTRVRRICGCYVDGQKNKITEIREAFLSLPDEAMFKYCDLQRRTLSGTVGKNLFSLDFPLDEEAPGGKADLLLQLRDSELQDPDLVNAFFDRVIGSFLCAENYLILLAYGQYDVPGHTSDREELEDASEYVYSFLLCSICPVTLSKAGLMYDPENNCFIDKIQDWMVQVPEAGFLYPAFSDRNTDLHSVLFYSKDAELPHPEIPEDLLGCPLPVPAADQKESFNTVVEETFEKECDFAVAKAVHTAVNAVLEGQKDDPEPMPLEKNDVKRILSDCGADDDALERFENAWPSDTEEKPAILASNLANTRSFTVKTQDIRVSVSAERADLLETRILDGRECLIIPLDGNVEVNGIRIRTHADPSAV